MTLENILALLENADRLRVIKDGQELYTGYVAMFADKYKITENSPLFERHKGEEVERFRSVPEITHREWRERNLASPLMPEQTQEFCFRDLQMSIYYTIYLAGQKEVKE